MKEIVQQKVTAANRALHIPDQAYWNVTSIL